MKEFLDKLDRFEHDLQNVRKIVLLEQYSYADELMFKLKTTYDDLHRLVWLEHHKSGEKG